MFSISKLILLLCQGGTMTEHSASEHTGLPTDSHGPELKAQAFCIEQRAYSQVARGHFHCLSQCVISCCLFVLVCVFVCVSVSVCVCVCQLQEDILCLHTAHIVKPFALDLDLFLFEYQILLFSFTPQHIIGVWPSMANTSSQVETPQKSALLSFLTHPLQLADFLICFIILSF